MITFNIRKVKPVNTFPEAGINTFVAKRVYKVLIWLDDINY